jgi:MazG family protein
MHAALDRLVNVMNRLLAPDGCPWDREQTFESLRKYVIEEAFEVAEAIDSGSVDAIREELGDQVFLVAFLAAIAEARGAFKLEDVLTGISDKMVKRHPWVFTEDRAIDSASAMARWEAQKATERKAKGALSGVPVALPALLRAFRVGEKAAAHGYDWHDVAGVRAKLDEEVAELDQAITGDDPSRIEHELGDVLFTVANLGRKLGVDPESALRVALDRFSKRFRSAELEAAHAGRKLADLTDSERDAMWLRAKESHP